MKHVVFTGPAIDSLGRSVKRANLIQACEAKGDLLVQSSVGRQTDLLVASRSDTTKAKAAQAKGISVLTYPEFIECYLRGVMLETGGKMNPYTDGVDPDMIVPCFITGEDLAKLDNL